MSKVAHICFRLIIYVHKIVFKFKCIRECWLNLKQLVSPSLNTTSLVHVRAFTRGGFKEKGLVGH